MDIQDQQGDPSVQRSTIKNCFKLDANFMIHCPNHQNNSGLRPLGIWVLYTFSIPVCVRLVWPHDVDANVICLLLCQCCELCTQGRQMEPGHLLVQLLWEEVHVVFVLLRLLPVLEEIQLCKCLIGERTRHD